jgi:hypothetical protein
MQTACVNVAYAKNKLPCATIPNRSGIWFVADVDIGHLTGAAMNKCNTEECLIPTLIMSDRRLPNRGERWT